MKQYSFKPPQEHLEPRRWEANVTHNITNYGKYTRNCLLDAKIENADQNVPSYLVTADAIHPLCGMTNEQGITESRYGALLDSTNSAATITQIKAVIKPYNTTVKWTPGGQGINSWLAVKLTSPTLVQKYIVATQSNECPLSWKLQASNDGTNWVTIDTITNTNVWTLLKREEKTFEIPAENRGIYHWYRIYIISTNATTLALSTFRLLRDETTCARGQLKLDADAQNPLIVTFMDGYGTDGTTPIDHIETIINPIVKPVGDFDNGGTALGSAAATAPLPLNIFLKRDTTGNVTVELEADSSTEVPFFNGAMTAYEQATFKVTDGTGSIEYIKNHYTIWGQLIAMNGYNAPGSTLSKYDNTPFYVYKITRGDIPLTITEINGAKTPHSNLVNRYVKALTLANVSVPTGGSTGAILYTSKHPYRYKVEAGKLWQQHIAEGTPWAAVQKVKIGTCVWNGTDIYQLNLVCAISTQSTVY